MSAKADALRLPATPSGHQHWYAVLVAVLVGLGVVGALTLMRSLGSDTATDRVLPSHHAGRAHVAVVAPASDVLQVGGTSAYRFHPLPGVNTVFELARPVAAQAGAGTARGTRTNAAVVGGTSVYRYHQLP